MGASAATPAHILVVEDEPAVHELVEAILAAQGYAVSVCTSAAAAGTALASGDRFDAVLLDASIGKLDGALVGRLPVVLTSGFDEARAREGLADVAIAAFLPKPFRPAELFGAIERALRDAGASPE